MGRRPSEIVTPRPEGAAICIAQGEALGAGKAFNG
ncbi:hypothetical protein Mal33_30180 [Rosistilla oblonga]|uniref:Uncharacterized protein n=1 Tax=Rosistilla oblonga TaxID=2527990 RepID=A0A518IVA3_9BACT|nr:hypothetical protein Mal33_30180 [Rosistilla oblonga]